ncbi:carbohydrate ABC transporter membrane protein 1, CUT1 family [Actinokineospora alba]|uniref:Carbohydrate ABC transporter membrane protein 1, CUT1 family n=1 Tax=Actinokineospora alba TaxID=504798 RepID=A0A1H0IFK6_9PSEU|nr:sugar ABC transporter permease [Actinokineospora alba]TDP70975.1 raffinose/stachyose/melibiose transport system permease protein [Actinokineospora alba]SDI88751.1 raffinose/stachyose/melibiose transport system permease protein [Actinokineospora alba]SDO29831.1 carbohydrate ABC transporter membrane protein 1, CUT1 family [Actinokineospora alba]
MTAALGAHKAGRRRLFLPFFLPAVSLYVLFLLVPTIATVVLGFTSWAGAGDTPRFTGLANFGELLASDSFRFSFLNTVLYIVVGGVGTFLLAFLFTMVLRDMRGGKTVRAILFFPNIVAPVALGMFFGIVLIFRPNRQGLVNYVLESFGIDAVKFLAPENVTWVVTGCLIWASAGFYITILMAAVDRIPPYLYEDADIAGASPWQKFRNITLPLTWDVIGVAGVLWTIGAIKIFELVFVLAGPGTYSPPIKSWTLGVYVFDRSFGTAGSPEYGMACAAAVVMIALVSVLVVMLRRMMRRDSVQF